MSFFKNLFKSKSEKKLERLTRIVNWNNGGIEKRIDELREDIEYLLQICPEVFIEKPWLIRHLELLDDYLVNLCEEFCIDESKRLSTREYPEGSVIRFPRPLPDINRFLRELSIKK